MQRSGLLLTSPPRRRLAREQLASLLGAAVGALQARLLGVRLQLLGASKRALPDTSQVREHHRDKEKERAQFNCEQRTEFKVVVLHGVHGH
jgi:hypothetical protein